MEKKHIEINLMVNVGFETTVTKKNQE